jgi:hypothetical protein
MTANNRRRRGLTLMETILAVAVAGLILGILHTSLWVGVKSYRASRGRAATETMVLTAFSLLSDDVGRLTLQVPGGPASLWSSPRIGGGPLLRTRIGARVAAGQEDMLVDWFYVADKGSLIRRSQQLGQPEATASEANDQGSYEIAASGLTGVAFRFFDGAEWRDEWDSAAGEIPKMIELKAEAAGGETAYSLTRTVCVTIEPPLIPCAPSEGGE